MDYELAPMANIRGLGPVCLIKTNIVSDFWHFSFAIPVDSYAKDSGWELQDGLRSI